MARVTRAIILLCIAVQLALMAVGPNLGYAIMLEAALVPARLSGAVDLQGAVVPAPLTLLTSLFLHANLMHLALNLVFLAWVGKFTEWVLGPGRFILLYALGGIGGGLLQVVASPDSTVPVVGASGAIAAVFGCYALLFSRHQATAPAGNALRIAAVWIGLQLLIGFVANTDAGGIAIWSHIGGFLVGLLFAQPWTRRLRGS